MPEPPKQIINQLTQQLNTLKQERDKLNSEAKAWAEKRNAIHEQIKALKTEAKQAKEKRDETNRKVKELKALREQARRKQKEKRVEVSKVKEKMRAVSGKKPPSSMADIQDEIQRLEWEIQTTSMPLKEEKVLVDQVRILERQRAVHKRLQELRTALFKMQTEEETSAAKADQHHENLTELASEGQELHEQMLELLTKAKNLKLEADATHQKYVEIRQKADETHQKSLELLQQINSIRRKTQKKEEEQQAKKQQTLREEAVKKAQEKMKRGEKLTWDEFKLLTEQEEDEAGATER